MTIKSRVFLSRIIAGAIGVFFIFSSIAKIVGANSGTLFGNVLHGRPVVAYVILFTELMMGVWLLIGWSPSVAWFTTIVIVALYTGVLVVEITQKLPIPCGCMGASYVISHNPWRIRFNIALSIFRNASFCIALAWLFRGQARMNVQSELLSDGSSSTI